MKIDFKGKTVLVTGATRGIGQKIADSFVSLGAYVIATGTHPDKIEQLNKARKKGSKRTYHCVDFRDPQATSAFLKELDVYKRIDVCVNNAGINHINFLDETKEEDWNDIVGVNLRAPFMISRYLAKRMKKQRYGRIVNISSIFGVISREKRSIYTMTKYGIRGMTVTAAIELGKYNVLVNSVAPGFIETDLTKKNLSAKDKAVIKAQVPLKRLGNPQEVANVVLFLSSGLNTYLTGQNIVVDGGYVCV